MNKLTIAENALKTGRYRQALKIYRSIVIEEPGNALVRQGLAQALLRMRAHDEAITESKKAIELNPNLSLPHVVMAYAYYSKNDFESFRYKAQEAYKLDPVSADVLTCYGIMLLVDKDQEGAINAFTEAVKINPLDVVARTNLAYAFSLAGNIRESLDQFKKVFLISPSVTTAIRVLSAFHETHASSFGILLVLITATAFFLRNDYLLLPSVIYATYSLVVGIRLILMKKWKQGLFGFGYAILLTIIAALIYDYINNT